MLARANTRKVRLWGRNGWTHTECLDAIRYEDDDITDVCFYGMRGAGPVKIVGPKKDVEDLARKLLQVAHAQDEKEFEYVQSGGVACPYCGSEDIVGDSIQVEGGTAWQKITCNGCDEQWQDTYVLAGVFRQERDLER